MKRAAFIHFWFKTDFSNQMDAACISDYINYTNISVLWTQSPIFDQMYIFLDGCRHPFEERRSSVINKFERRNAGTLQFDILTIPRPESATAYLAFINGRGPISGSTDEATLWGKQTRRIQFLKTCTASIQVALTMSSKWYIRGGSPRCSMSQNVFSLAPQW